MKKEKVVKKYLMLVVTLITCFGWIESSYAFPGGDEDITQTSSVNNYICLGDSSTTGECNSDNLYRIIGIVKDDKTGTNLEDGMIKVIKNSPMNNGARYKWDGGIGTTTGLIREDTYQRYNGSSPMSETGTEDGYMPTWDESCLNKWDASRCTGTGNAAYSLNGETNSFISSINFADKIAEVSWHCYNGTTKPTSDVELENTNVCNTPQKIGLMYGSDYLMSYNNGINPSSEAYVGWLYKTDQWTMSSCGFDFTSPSRFSWFSWRADSLGRLTTSSPFYYAGGTLLANASAVRPVFYLKSTISYEGGDGTINDPIRIN